MANKIDFVQKRIAKLKIKLENTNERNHIERDRILIQIAELEDRLSHHVTKKHRAGCNRQRKVIINQILDDE